MTHDGLRRAHYKAGLNAHTQELDPPKRTPHNLPTIPRQSRGLWFLSGMSTDTEFVFIHAASFRKVVKTAADGWTREDADTFNNSLLFR